MSGKGSAPRPFAVSDDVYSANWALVFGDAKTMGHSSTAEQGALTASVVSSNLTAPAIYVDNATGQEVTEEWWPDPLTPAHAAVQGG